jgi:pimeloyl-ACP methyl ester carboxylesterase
MIKNYNNFIIEIHTQLKEPPKNIPSILFINGSREWLKDDLSLNIYRRNQKTSNILPQFGHHVIYGNVYWRAGDIIFEDMREIIENHNIKAIVGNSAGGYAAFYLSNKYKIPAMSINPAMCSTSTAPTLQPLPDDMKNLPLFPKQLIVVGDKDSKVNKGVDMNLVVEYLNKIGFEEKGGTILTLEDTYHKISKEQFDMAFKVFYKKYMI